MDAVADKLLSKLRQLAPHKVRVYDGSDTAREIAVPQRRKRWSQVIETIEAVPWVRCELLDKSGAVLGYVENDAAAGELEDLGSGVPAGAAGNKWFLDTMIRAQREALTWVEKSNAANMQAMAEILRVNAHATSELVELYRVQRDVSTEIATMRAAAENKDVFDQMVKLLEAYPELKQMIGPLVLRLMGTVAPKTTPRATPANGAKQ